MDKLLKLGNQYHMVNNDSEETTTVRDTVSFLALALFEDVRELRNTEQDVQKRLALETMSLNAIAHATEVLSK